MLARTSCRCRTADFTVQKECKARTYIQHRACVNFKPTSAGLVHRLLKGFSPGGRTRYRGSASQKSLMTEGSVLRAQRNFLNIEARRPMPLACMIWRQCVGGVFQPIRVSTRYKGQ